MSAETVNLTPLLLRQLKMREVNFLKSREVLKLFKDEPWKMMAYGVMLRHTNMVKYQPQNNHLNYGIELEYSLKPTDYLTKQELKKCLAAGLRQMFIERGWGTNFSIEEDGTVPDGFEIVLGPHNINEVLYALRGIGADKLFNKFIDLDATNVGVHITVDKFAHQWQKNLFIDVWHEPWIHTLYSRIIGREPNQFCQLMNKRTNGTYEPNDYGIVSERENGSLEVRAFRNTGRIGHTGAQLQMVVHIDNWIRRGGNNLDKLYEDMKDWVFLRGF